MNIDQTTIDTSRFALLFRAEFLKDEIAKFEFSGLPAQSFRDELKAVEHAYDKLVVATLETSK